MFLFCLRMKVEAIFFGREKKEKRTEKRNTFIREKGENGSFSFGGARVFVVSIYI